MMATKAARYRARLLAGREMIRCCFCDKVMNTNEITLEHIVPLSRGGTWLRSNLTLACKRCNNTRGSLPFDEFKSLVHKLKEQGIADLARLAARKAELHEWDTPKTMAQALARHEALARAVDVATQEIRHLKTWIKKERREAEHEYRVRQQAAATMLEKERAQREVHAAMADDLAHVDQKKERA